MSFLSVKTSINKRLTWVAITLWKNWGILFPLALSNRSLEFAREAVVICPFLISVIQARISFGRRPDTSDISQWDKFKNGWFPLWLTLSFQIVPDVGLWKTKVHRSAFKNGYASLLGMCDIVMCPLNSNFLTVLGNVSLQVVDVRVDAAHYVIPLGDTLTKENIKDAPSCYFLHARKQRFR